MSRLSHTSALYLLGAPMYENCLHAKAVRETYQRFYGFAAVVSGVGTAALKLHFQQISSDEDKLLDDVVECVLKKRRKIPLHVADCPTGLHLKVEDFERTVLWQEQKNDKASVLVIIGLGGVGKSTLAKELFNRKRSNFNKSSFLYDVRETVRLSSLNSLQNILLKDLTQRTDQIDSIEKGIDILRERLSFSHALIILDDAYQLHAFLLVASVLHSDSLILFTSRNKNVLTSSGMAETSIYQLTGLNDQYSPQLLCSHDSKIL